MRGNPPASVTPSVVGRSERPNCEADVPVEFDRSTPPTGYCWSFGIRFRLRDATIVPASGLSDDPTDTTVVQSAIASTDLDGSEVRRGGEELPVGSVAEIGDFR
jgi:hypothetical protein